MISWIGYNVSPDLKVNPFESDGFRRPNVKHKTHFIVIVNWFILLMLCTYIVPLATVIFRLFKAWLGFDLLP